MKLNPHISIDCVIFGFDGASLKILLITRRLSNGSEDLKLPGDFISDNEDLDTAAARILKDLTGLDNIYLKQYNVYGSPQRISRSEDIEWLRQSTGLPITRVVTIAYYSLIRIHESKNEKASSHNAVWKSVDQVGKLAFDHEKILKDGLDILRAKLKVKPVGMELLPNKFTIRQLQTLYEVILGRELDNRNFRKKVLKANYLTPLDEKEHNVAHKPARLFSFNRKVFHDSFNHFDGFQF